MKNNNFLRKLKYFFKRNAYTIAVTTCVALAVTLVSISAVVYFNDGDSLPVINVITDPSKPTDSGSVVVFDLPIKDGEVYKIYSEDDLLEDKTSGDWQTHQAIDFKAAEGTSVLAVYDGTVEDIVDDMMDGLIITLSHDGNMKTVYKCLQSEAMVKKGDKVRKGQEIGKVGTNLTEKQDGAHLHFELYKDGELVDPTGLFADLSK